MELLLHLLAVFCFALLMSIIGHFKDEVPLVGRFIIDVVAAVLSTLWDIVSFPFEFWADPLGESVCMAFKALEAIIYLGIFSTGAHVLLFDQLYKISNDNRARVESRYHIVSGTKMVFESCCFNVKTAIDGYREAYDKMVPLLQHDLADSVEEDMESNEASTT